MRHVEFRRSLDDDNELRISFDSDRGEISKFTVQLECRFDNEDWIAVIRYDTAHGFAHCDVLHPYKATAKTEMLTRNYNEALTFAINQLAENWFEYRRRYELWKNPK